MNLTLLFENSFGWRKKPVNIFSETYCTSDGKLIANVFLDRQYEETNYFLNRDWRTLTIQELQENPDVISGTNPEAYCYFLPGILCAAYQENIINISVVDFILWNLQFYDSNKETTELEKNYSYVRWIQLTKAELLAVKEWLNWFYESNGIESDEYKVACETLDWLISKKSEN